MIARRRHWRERYRALAASLAGVSVLGGHDDAADNCWVTALVVDQERAGWSAAGLGRALAASGIESRPVWKPMHQQPVFSSFHGTLNGSSDHLFVDGITLPSGSGMSVADLERIERAILEFGHAGS